MEELFLLGVGGYSGGLFLSLFATTIARLCVANLVGFNALFRIARFETSHNESLCLISQRSNIDGLCNGLSMRWVSRRYGVTRCGPLPLVPWTGMSVFHHRNED